MNATARLPEPLAGLSLDHVAVAVTDLEEATRAYLALGLSLAGDDERVDDQGVRVRPLQLGATLVELMAATRTDGPVGRFLRKRGPGLHHIALRVPALEPVLARLRALDAPLIDDTPRPGRAGTSVAFVHPRFTGGVLVELVEG